MYSLGALDVAFYVRLAHDKICVRILPFVRIATPPVLAADTSPVPAAPADHAMDEDGSDRHEAMPGARPRPPPPPRTGSTSSSRSALVLPLRSPRDVGVCELRSRVYPRRPTASGRSRYARLHGTPLFGLSSYALPFALSSVHTLIPSAAVAAAVATAAACACAAFIFAWPRPQPSKPPTAPRHPTTLPPLALLPTATFSGVFLAPSRSFALAPSHP
jgi:hypothetical protein